MLSSNWYILWLCFEWRFNQLPAICSFLVIILIIYFYTFLRQEQFPHLLSPLICCLICFFLRDKKCDYNYIKTVFFTYILKAVQERMNMNYTQLYIRAI